MTHEHVFGWSVEPEGTTWVVAATCECGEVAWACTARSSADLNAELRRAFHRKDLDALGYFTAPTSVPDDWATEVAA